VNINIRKLKTNIINLPSANPKYYLKKLIGMSYLKNNQKSKKSSVIAHFWQIKIAFVN
jgi:hypothetical protein